jgi:hypothetical protein
MTKEDYINVLENEIKVLLDEYYNPKEEGTGHFNTAASVLTQRLAELKNSDNIKFYAK